LGPIAALVNVIDGSDVAIEEAEGVAEVIYDRSEDAQAAAKDRLEDIDYVE